VSDPSELKIKDSGERQAFGTGGSQDTATGKPRFDMLPVYALSRVSHTYRKGLEKYPPEQKVDERIAVDNWRRGIDTSRFMQSLLRHAFAYLEGDRTEDHMAQLVWNGLGLIETEEMVRRGILPETLLTLPDWTKPGGNLTAEEAEHLAEFGCTSADFDRIDPEAYLSAVNGKIVDVGSTWGSYFSRRSPAEDFEPRRIYAENVQVGRRIDIRQGDVYVDDGFKPAMPLPEGLFTFPVTQIPDDQGEPGDFFSADPWYPPINRDKCGTMDGINPIGSRLLGEAGTDGLLIRK
jgi:hypothetical protein